MLPIPRKLIDLCQLDNPATTANTRHVSQTINTLIIDNTTTTDQIDFAAAQVMTIIHDESHDITTNHMADAITKIRHGNHHTT
jgi:hypothetical protein